MRLILLSFAFLSITLQANAQLEFDHILKRDYIDSNNFKNRGIYLTFSPVCVGVSINTDNKRGFTNASMRGGIHWMTKNYQKFQFFASYGGVYASSVYGTGTMETGIMMGKLIKGRRWAFFDLNVGVAYFYRDGIDGYEYLISGKDTSKEIYEVHTVGIPFEATIYSIKSPLGIGIGVVGNLNVNQPYASFLMSFRLGNPALKKHSALNWFR